MAVPEGVSAEQLDPQARAELRTLPGDLADAVATWMVAAAAEPDPDRAYEFAVQARKLAARVGVVRETAGVAAYRAGRWADALAELRTARRLTGRASYLPLMADAERALGRADRALALIHDPDTKLLDRATQIELLIVESGIRRDQGRAAAGAVVLQVPELTNGIPGPWSARLFYAYADALYDAGRREEARDWFGRAAALDPDEETDAGERYEILDSIIIEDLVEEPDEDPGAEPAPGAATTGPDGNEAAGSAPEAAAAGPADAAAGPAPEAEAAGATGKAAAGPAPAAAQAGPTERVAANQAPETAQPGPADEAADDQAPEAAQPGPAGGATAGPAPAAPGADEP